MKRITLLTFIFIITTFSVSAKFQKERLVYGGNLGLSYYDGLFQIGLRPNAGYKITNFWTLGALGTYYYTNYYNVNLSIHTVGVGAYTRFFLSGLMKKKISTDFFLQADYERLWHFTSRDVLGDETLATYNSDILLIGVGLTQPISERLRFVLSLSFDVLETVKNNHFIPVLRVGLEF